MKLVVALTFAAILMALLIQFKNFVGPMIGAFVLAYLVNPLADRVHRNTNLPWRLVVTILYFLIVVSLLGLLAWGGVTLIEQIQSLINFLQNAVNDVPGLLLNLSSHPFVFGPLVLDFTKLDLASLSNEILSVVQPLLSRLGTLVGSFASSAVTTLGWISFIVLISYFILSETGGQSRKLIGLHIPGYEEDLDRMGYELGRIWNAFLRGQFIIIGMTVSLYTMMFGLLGVHYYFGLALVAGMARFIPYIGPLIAWTTYGLVSYFQGVSLFGMPQLTYALMVVGIAWVTDNIIDSLVTPRIMADALSIHPAAVLVGALIGINLLGFVGVLLAAPVLASLKLITSYIIRKLSDLDPWANMKAASPGIQPLRILERFRAVSEQVLLFWRRLQNWTKEKIQVIRNRKHPRPE